MNRHEGSVLLIVLIVFSAMALALHGLFEHFQLESQIYSNQLHQYESNLADRKALQQQFRQLASNNFVILEQLPVGSSATLSEQPLIVVNRSHELKLLLSTQSIGRQFLLIEFVISNTGSNHNASPVFHTSYWYRDID